MLDCSKALRWAIVLAMVLALNSIVPLGLKVNKNFLPQDDESQFQVQARAPEGSSLPTTQTIMESIANRVRQIPEVATTVVTIGDDPQITQNLGTIYVQLVPVEKRKRDQFAIMADVRQNIMPQYARLNLRTNVSPVNAFGGGVNAEIMYWIGGPDLDKLEQYSNVLLAKLNEMKKIGVVDPDTNYVTGKPELGVRIDRAKAADLGVRVQDIASTLNVLVGGLKVTDYYEGGEQYEVHVRAEHEFRKDQQGISQAQVPSAKSGAVQIRDVVHMTPGSGPSTINRISRQRQVMLTANMAPGYSTQTVMDAIVKDTNDLKMPPEYSSGFTGLPREQAIREANRDRLRPILMTTLAFVAGMVPLVASSGTGAATNRAIGSVIIGGQTLALLLTLLATPVAYSLFDDIQERSRARKAAKKAAAESDASLTPAEA